MANMQSRRLLLGRADIDRFIDEMNRSGKAPATINKYAKSLNRLYAYLPQDKQIDAERLYTYISNCQQRYSVSTLNGIIAACNNYLRFKGRMDLAVGSLPETREKRSPELTRSEYLRLLVAAKALHMRRNYLLVKLFGNTPIGVNDMEALTVEAVSRGVVMLKDDKLITLPELLRQELLDYAHDEGVCSGCLFRTSSGRAYGRDTVYKLIADLSAPANVSPEKVNPRCLHNLYLGMMQDYRQQYEKFIVDNFTMRLEAEQASVAWELPSRDIPSVSN